jgi:hypothetical protein
MGTMRRRAICALRLFSLLVFDQKGIEQFLRPPEGCALKGVNRLSKIYQTTLGGEIENA